MDQLGRCKRFFDGLFTVREAPHTNNNDLPVLVHLCNKTLRSVTQVPDPCAPLAHCSSTASYTNEKKNMTQNENQFAAQAQRKNTNTQNLSTHTRDRTHALRHAGPKSLDQTRRTWHSARLLCGTHILRCTKGCRHGVVVCHIRRGRVFSAGREQVANLVANAATQRRRQRRTTTKQQQSGQLRSRVVEPVHCTATTTTTHVVSCECHS